MTKPTHLFFDVNETLMDITGLREKVAETLGGGSVQADRWFNGVIEYSLAETLCGDPPAFGDIAGAVLAMHVAEDGGSLDLDEAKQIVKDGLQASTPYADVAPGLNALKEAGYTLVSLTNSGQAGLEKRLEEAGIRPCFDRALSVQASGGYKPHQKAYEQGLSELGVAPGAALMVACHPWDIIGAQKAGMQTAFVLRPGKAWYPLASQPDHTVPDIQALASRLVGTGEGH